MGKLKHKLKYKVKAFKEWFNQNKVNLLTAILVLPLAASVLAILIQGWYFSIYGEWLFSGQQLLIGTITSFAFWEGGKRLYGFIKMISNAG